jgi:phage shock protein A
MSLLHRLVHLIWSWIDWGVSRIENHDALVSSALRQVHESTARARVQLLSVKRDGDRLAERASKAEAEVAAWRDRARSEAARDEERALECLRRARRCQEQGEELRRRRSEHALAEQRLEADVARALERSQKLREQRNLLRTRQSRAEALDGLAVQNRALGVDLEATLERWDTRVTALEIESEIGTDQAGDSFEQGFVSAEEREDLRRELRELVLDAKETQ